MHFNAVSRVVFSDCRAEQRSAEAARIAAVAARASKIAVTASQTNYKSQKKLSASAAAWSPSRPPITPANSKHTQPSTSNRQCYGVDANALQVARKYMALHGNTARRITHRAVFERALRDTMEFDYYNTFPPDHLPFPAPNKIIFALAHAMKLLRVRGGRTLEWNRFRDNHGNKLR